LLAHADARSEAYRGPSTQFTREVWPRDAAERGLPRDEPPRTCPPRTSRSAEARRDHRMVPPAPAEPLPLPRQPWDTSR
jgi:hypothetical protein